MNKSGTKYSKLAFLLAKNNKLLYLLSLIVSILGFIFLFTVSSLSGTIVQTKQEMAVDKYGKFLVVMSDLDSNQIENIKKNNNDFELHEFNIEGNINYNNNKITMGSMKEQLGEQLGYRLLEGNWPSDANEIIIEEYLKTMFQIEDQQLPVSVTVMKDGKKVDYQVTGVISNYSSELSVCNDNIQDTKVYPSVISGMQHMKNGKTSLVISQKKLNLKNVEDDIKTVLNRCQTVQGTMENKSTNEKLHHYGFESNKDMIKFKFIYQLLLNILLIVEQIIIIRFVINRNKKILYLFEALGLSPKQRRRVMLVLTATIMVSAIVIGYLLANVIGILYMEKAFSEYTKYYMSLLAKSFLLECIIVGVIILGCYIGFRKANTKSISNEMVKNRIKEREGYKFKKIDFCTIFMQVICMFFMMGSMYFVLMFNFEQEKIEYHLYSKESVGSIPIKGYNVADYGDKYFSFDALSAFKGYEEYVSLSMTGDTRLSSILLDKDSEDGYFRENPALTQEDIFGLEKKVPKEAEQYQVVSERYLEIVVLPKNEFQAFMSNAGIQNAALENEKDLSCVAIVPNYNTIESKASIKENHDIQVGRVQYAKDGLEFKTAKFKVEKLLVSDDTTNPRVQLVMSEDVARKSNFILGYNIISITMLKETPISIQKEIEQKVSLLMAMTQGGMLDSSLEVAKEDSLMKGYTTIMCNTILLFCTLSIFIYVLLSSYNDWEKHRHDYGVLRSFGMSYSTLQHKLFLKHNNSMIISSIIAIILGKIAFSNGMLSVFHIVFTIMIVFIITNLCKFLIYELYKEVEISNMIKEN